MNQADSNLTAGGAGQPGAGVRLHDELARLCLPEADRDPDRPLAWVNSICLVFLLIGLCGARRGLVDIRAVAPLEEPVPVVVEPVVLPPTESREQKAEHPAPTAEAAPVAVVIPPMPSIQFSVPTIGGLLAPAALAAAPPAEPLRTYAQVLAIENTGEHGERPKPPYPKIALEEGEQGSVTLTLQGDAAGNILAADLKTSSGYPVLDRATVEFIRRHWHLPAGPGPQTFLTTIIYRLQLN